MTGPPVSPPRRKTTAKRKPGLAKTLGTAGKIGFYNLPSFLGSTRSGQADDETQRLLDEYASEGGDPSAHAGLFGGAAAAGTALGGAAGMLGPVKLASGLMKALGVGGEVLGGTLTGMGTGAAEGALAEDDPGKRYAAMAQRGALGAAGGAAGGMLAKRMAAPPREIQMPTNRMYMGRPRTANRMDDGSRNFFNRIDDVGDGLPTHDETIAELQAALDAETNSQMRHFLHNALNGAKAKKMGSTGPSGMDSGSLAGWQQMMDDMRAAGAGPHPPGGSVNPNANRGPTPGSENFWDDVTATPPPTQGLKPLMANEILDLLRKAPWKLNMLIGSASLTNRSPEQRK